MSNIRVAVRIRPLSESENKSKQVHKIVSISPDGKIHVTNPKVPEHNAGDSRERVKHFSFDYCFGAEVTQSEIFNTLGGGIIQSVLNKYNACVLAYGQSATGKTYTMMGNEDEPGLTPRLCRGVFTKLENQYPNMFQISVSFLEIYNERVQDLLAESKSGRALRVREHPKQGPYVEGLRNNSVKTIDELLSLIKKGENLRRVASTLTNNLSSRSHSVLTISCNFLDTYGKSSQSRLYLVDLAGSERASSVQNSTCRLKEGANINRSLVALGNVITALADISVIKHNRFIPYRDSILTWLLKETLGGNSNTFMVAAISPSSSCYSETVNTLRFGQRAKHIKNEPTINEDPTSRIIRELREEIARLKQIIAGQKLNDMGSVLQQINNPENTEPTTEPIVIAPQPTPPVELTPPTVVVPTIPKISTAIKRARSAIEIQRSQRKLQSKLSNSLEILNESTEKNISKKVPRKMLSAASSNASLSTDEKTKKSVDIKDAIKKHQQNKRSEIVASVTDRLYSKQRRKSTISENSYPTRSSSSSLMSDLSICSNARTRLQEISLKALSASRRTKRHVSVGMQTDKIHTVRVKDIGINTPVDINSLLDFVKDACVETSNLEELVKFHSISVGSDESLPQNFKLTRSCGNTTDTDSIDSYTPFHKRYPREKILSFTKYITRNTQTPENTPCYNTSVNIHFNCSLDDSRDGSISDDSLDGRKDTQPPPDLLHNHSENSSLLVVEEKSLNFAAQYGNIEILDTVTEFIAVGVVYCTAGVTYEQRSFHAARVSTISLHRPRIIRKPRFRPEPKVPRLSEPNELALSTANFLNAASYFLSNISTPSNCCLHNSKERFRRSGSFDVQSSDSEDLTYNKWEKRVLLSCDRLEERLNDNVSLLRNKGSRRSVPSFRSSYSPRAYLSELQKMRRKLVEDSRELIDLIDN